jgi:two-component system chemotaxis sensor kinase CheA
MQTDDLQAELLATFLDELDEVLVAWNRDLLMLERQAPLADRTGLVRSLFRSAHSIKGAARAAGVLDLEQICHLLETVLSSARQGLVDLDAATLALFLAAGDAMAVIGRQVRAGEPLDLAAKTALLDRLAPVVLAATTKGPMTAPLAALAIESAPEACEPARPDQAAATTAMVRVAAGQLEALLSDCTELLIASRRVQDWQRRGLQARTAKESERFQAEGGQTLQVLTHIVERVHAGVRGVQMVPLEVAFAGLERMVRDLALAAGKPIEFKTSGAEILVDRAIAHGLQDPLRHLLRNAIDHGIETPAERQQQGKGAVATVRLDAQVHGALVDIQVSDDGRGLDVAALRARARRLGVPVPEDEPTALQLAFLPGLSTARLVTDTSGRGVGLDIVKTRIEAWQGRVTAGRHPSGGASFVVQVPLSSTVLRVLHVRVAGQLAAIAVSAVIGVARAGAEDLTRVDGREVLRWQGQFVPISSLAKVLGLLGVAAETRPKTVSVVVLRSGVTTQALVVDELLAEGEVVVEPFGARIGSTPLASGAARLPTGRIAVVLNVAGVLQLAALGQGTDRVGLGPAHAARVWRLVVADDTLTTRSLHKSILETAGYDVRTAADGEQAWQLVQAHGADLVVSDVEMPHMDGFQLTEAIRASKQYADLPVVLVTGLADEADKARGLAAGANAYLVKSAFDQHSLLGAIEQLLAYTEAP